ncbi:unnamed protein product, partial [Tetraodon nigroviridis]
KFFKEEDFASVIRKKQSASWALKCVRSGVDHFKHGRHVDAMNEYNKALDIDKNNVEALVARGALYANKGSILKAIADFELALENCPDHRNAKKYLCQTLVERGRQLEEQEKLVTAEGLYRRALALDDANAEAQEALRKINQTIQKSIRLREEALQKDQGTAKSGQTSADKLRKILKEEKRLKKKQKREGGRGGSESRRRVKSSRKSLSGSPEKGERVNRGKEESRKDCRRRTSCSSAEAEPSWNRLEGRRQERRNSSEGGRYKNSGGQEPPDNPRAERDGRREREEESSRAEAGSSSRSEGPGASWASAGRPRKELPSSLLDIFSQIAQFEKEKGIRPK